LAPARPPGARFARLIRPRSRHRDRSGQGRQREPARRCPPPRASPTSEGAALIATALAAAGYVGWSVCIYNPDLDPGRDHAGAIISYITSAITASDQPAR
jgi:arginase